MSTALANYDYFDHKADMGIIGRGASLEEAFIHAAEAMFAYMADISQVQSKETFSFEWEEQDQELALVEWLNTLLGNARQKNLIFARFELKRDNNHWLAHAYGDRWRESLERGTEVKGATLTMLSVRKCDSHWEARCVVDV